jgi:hypothetical protein
MIQAYRLYCLRDRHIVGVEEIFAADDAAALRQAQPIRARHPRELWRGGRLVAVLPADAEAVAGKG